MSDKTFIDKIIDKSAEAIIKLNAKTLHLKYGIGTFEECEKIYSDFQSGKETEQSSDLSKEEMEDMVKAIDQIKTVSVNYTKIPIRRVIDIFDTTIKEMKDKSGELEQKEQEEQKL